VITRASQQPAAKRPSSCHPAFLQRRIGTDIASNLGNPSLQIGWFCRFGLASHAARFYLPEIATFTTCWETTMNTMATANRFRSLIATALFGVLSSSLAALPAAADSFEPLQVTVMFGDLDVSHSQGAAVLYRRIFAAAEKVCSPYDGGGLSNKMQRDACVNKAIVDAVTAVNQPALLAVYSAKTGKALFARVASVQNR
jgi:UrcA family protein